MSHGGVELARAAWPARLGLAAALAASFGVLATGVGIELRCDAARCEHLYRGNSCHCTARLGNALECGLVGWPDHGDHDGSAFITKPRSDVAALYASLPRVRLPVLTGEA